MNGSSPSTHGPTPAHQARSRRTAERIVAAALELLATKPFEAMGVAEIAARAGVSVGGFYGRFPGKAALLEHLYGTLLHGLVERARELLAPESVQGLGARAVVERYVRMAVEGFRRHRPVLRQVALRSRTSADPGFRRRIRETNRALHDLFRARLLERREEIAHPEPRVAIDVALTAVSGAMREYVLFAAERPWFDPLDDERLVAELVELFSRYLRIEA